MLVQGLIIKMETSKKPISAKMAASLTGVGYLTIIRAIHTGKISARKPGKDFLLDQEEVIAWANKKFEPKLKKITDLLIQE